MTAPSDDRAAGMPPPELPPPVEVGPMLSDGGAVAVAAAAALGAWFHRPAPLALLIVAAVAVLASRRPVLLGVLVLLCAGEFGARSMAGMEPAAAGPFSGVVTLVGDPKETPFGVRVDVRADGRRFELHASHGGAGGVRSSAAGERVRVEGKVAPPPEGAPWLVPRHVVGRLTVARSERVDGGSAPWRAANRIRRTMERGSESMPATDRALYRGFVLGDDRDQPPEIVDDFRGSGLTHLLVVSGQNVAFVLVLVGPVLGRLGARGRWAATLLVIALFATVTRFEPSVLRASAMAAIAVTSGAVGRPSVSLRNLALAITALLLVDPLLVRSVAFQLSVGASAAIAVLAERLAAALPGPRWVVTPLAVVLAAQVGVAPVIIPRFGGLPVASIPANLLAGPVSGLVTTWGLPAGLVAGLVGGPVGEVVHLPTRLCVGWVAGVARVAAALPLGDVGARHALALAAAAGAGWWLGPRVRALAVAVCIAIVLAPAIALRTPVPVSEVAGGTLHRSREATVLVTSSQRGSVSLLEDLRRAGVRRLDLVVVEPPGAAAMIGTLRHRWAVGEVLVVGDERLEVTVADLTVTAGGDAPISVRSR